MKWKSIVRKRRKKTLNLRQICPTMHEITNT
uniref:Uncharacterized protein n=1 Tax=Rhizophora mucronata TaxID=61149 RepID=A0A2P2PNP2_RHIMU